MRRRLLWLLIAFLAIDALVLVFWFRNWRERRYDIEIRQAAYRYKVDPALVKAVVWRESAFDAKARGAAGELGLMQIREPAAIEWATAEKIHGFDHASLKDPKLNTLAGTWYLSKLLGRYRKTDDAIPYALADYNAGRGNVLRWLDGAAKTNSAEFVRQIQFPGTRQYVRDITAKYSDYRKRFR